MLNAVAKWRTGRSEDLDIVAELVRDTLSACIDMLFIFERIGRPHQFMTANSLLGKISHKVEASVRFTTRTSHRLQSSHFQLPKVLSRWKSSNRLQTEIIPRRRFCRKSDKHKNQPHVVLRVSLDRMRFCRFHGRIKSKQPYPKAALNLRLYRLMHGYAWRAFQN